MMRTYMSRTGRLAETEELNHLCEKLQKTNTREEVDAVGCLLTDFASLNIQKGITPS